MSECRLEQELTSGRIPDFVLTLLGVTRIEMAHRLLSSRVEEIEPLLNERDRLKYEPIVCGDKELPGLHSVSRSPYARYGPGEIWRHLEIRDACGEANAAVNRLKADFLDFAMANLTPEEAQEVWNAHWNSPRWETWSGTPTW